jgi:hypothetical protein
MTYKEKVAVCSKICTKHWTQSEHRVEFFNVNFNIYIFHSVVFLKLLKTY